MERHQSNYRMYLISCKGLYDNPNLFWSLYFHRLYFHELEERYKFISHKQGFPHHQNYFKENFSFSIRKKLCGKKFSEGMLYSYMRICSNALSYFTWRIPLIFYHWPDPFEFFLSILRCTFVTKRTLTSCKARETLLSYSFIIYTWLYFLQGCRTQSQEVLTWGFSWISVSLRLLKMPKAPFCKDIRNSRLTNGGVNDTDIK